MIYLYVKTHNKTGLKYLGKTVKKDPHAYKGSGKVWRDHCSKHGYDYTTDILFQSEHNEEIREKGIYYSNLWNVVESKEWANLVLEEGGGGITPGSFKKGRIDTRSPETKAEAARKASIKLKGKKKPEGFGEKISAFHKGKIVAEESKVKMKSAWTPERRAAQAERTRLQNASRPILTCPHCGFQGTNTGNMKRYHFDKCLQVDLKENPIQVQVCASSSTQ